MNVVKTYVVHAYVDLAIRLPLEVLEARARGLLGDPTASLELIPMFLYDHTGAGPVGTLAVDGEDGSVRVWTAELRPVGADAPLADHSPTQITEAAAAKQALAYLATRDPTPSVTKKHGPVRIRTRTPPAAGDPELDFLGLYYVPVWRFSSRQGTLRIDAVAGQFLDPLPQD